MHRHLSETETRYSLIDPQLRRAGWDVYDRTQVRIEVPVAGYDDADDGGFTDYCLYHSNGSILTVIEAKRTHRDARAGKQQVLDYVTSIEKQQDYRPFAFMTNGEDIFFWESDSTAERRVAGFFTREDLERFLFLKQNRIPLNQVQIKESIVNRSYQIEAIRRISETLEVRKKRKALLVMATGTGKTRTVMALIDVFLQAHAAQKVLFLADRDALVEQARTDGFKVHLPHEAQGRIRSYMQDRTKRLYVSTLQTLELCFKDYSPAEFDLIITDECHRSIYNKFTDVLAYFDGVQIGLTATPASFIDRDTFRFFECDGNVPTFLYPYDEAVNDGHLVDFNVWAAQTKFQRKGIKGAELSEEDKESLRKRGIDPDAINFEGTDLEKKVTNRDTLRRQWQEFMEVCSRDATGQLPGKSIIFAMTHKHALRLEETFNEMFPEYGGKLVSVITSKMERADELFRKFKKQDLPRIAISVDMLDTGVDIPEVVNLAFMKPVNSAIKFWQMIGRGTRNHDACRRTEWLPNGVKERFLIVDYWENFEHFEMKKPTDEGPVQIPVLVTIFNTRLEKLSLMMELGTWRTAPLQWLEEDRQRTISDIRSLIARIPTDSFTVRQQLAAVREAWDDDFWKMITKKKLEFLRLQVGPLLRFAAGVNPAEAFFTSKMDRYGLTRMQNKDAETQLKIIQEDVARLQTNIAEVAAHIDTINQVLSWHVGTRHAVSPRMIDEARDELAPLMKYKRPEDYEPFELGLDDIMESRKWVILHEDAQPMHVEEYRKRIEAKIMQLADSHPTIRKLRADEDVSDEDLIRLEQMLEAELGTEEFSLDDENMFCAFGVRVGSLVDFLKHVLDLAPLPTQEDVVRRAFDAFILEHNYNADQSRFLRAVQSVFLQRHKLEEDDLYEPPLTNFGENAVERLFRDGEIEELMEMVKNLRE